MNYQNGINLWNKAKRLIPGGTQLLSKRVERFAPEKWPCYYKKAKGVEIWDIDGNKYIDMTIMGVGACSLGYADDDVNQAVKQVIEEGTMTTLNVPEEVELAELLIKLHPWAGGVRFARTGGEAMAIAVRIARAWSKKDKIAFCGYHGWHDWYIASNLANDSNLDGHLLDGLEPNGVPRSLINSAIPFEYNNIEKLESIITNNNDIGVIVVETIRHSEPKDNFLKKIREIANEIGAALIFDEITIGWRLAIGGAHLVYGVNPDIAVFAKTMSNGYPMAAIIGRESVMDAAQTSFISSAYWTERIGPVAAITTINKMQKVQLPSHLDNIGSLIGNGWKALAEKHNINIEVLPPKPLVTFSFKDWENVQEINTLFTQEMLKRGFLAGTSVYLSLCHTEEVISLYLKSVDESFEIIKKALDDGNILKYLEGPPAMAGFKRLT